MRQFAVICIFFLLSILSMVRAEESSVAEADDAQESARFAFVNLNTDGSLTFTFNATSLQYALLAGLAALVIAAILIPLLGLLGLIDKDKWFGGAPEAGYGYDQQQYTYEAPTSYQTKSQYSSYTKRSLDMLSPVMEALSKSYKKYEENEHQD